MIDCPYDNFLCFLYFSKLFMRQKLQNKIPHHCLQQFPLHQREAYVLFASKNNCFVSVNSVINVVYQYSYPYPQKFNCPFSEMYLLYIIVVCWTAYSFSK